VKSDDRGAERRSRNCSARVTNLQPWEENDFTVRSQTEIATAAQSTTQVLTILLASIASISLIVGGIGIMNIMLVSVTERTKEIGIRMAIGATAKNILMQFLIEAIVLSLLGGLIGVLLGVLSSNLISALAGWTTLVSPMSIILAFVFSAAVLGSSSDCILRAKRHNSILLTRCGTNDATTYHVHPQSCSRPR
jgi:ABC-type antimicrobial peptide transport system permease subunit